MSFNRNSGRALLPFGLDYSDILSTDISKEKPTLLLPINASLTDREVSIAKQSIAFTKLILDGPFYTGSSVATKRPGSSLESATASDGIERHSDKYKKVKKVGRTIEEYPYHLELFPDELYSVMGVSNKQKKKLLSFSSFRNDGGLKHFKVKEPSSDELAQGRLEKLKEMAETLDSDPNNNKEEEMGEEDDIEDEFEDDEDDDYNAEKYFDDGEDEVDDGDDDEAAF